MFVIATVFFLIFSSFNQLRIEKLPLDKEWVDYKLEYGLEFSEVEDSHRKEIFLENYRFIEDSNAKNTNFTLRMNKFGHLEKHERPGLVDSQYQFQLYGDVSPIFVGEEIPLEYDWRLDGVVSPVENQYDCGSCYAWSAVGAIESQFGILTGVLPNLSKQELIDCSRGYQNHGCIGGWEESVYEYSMDYGLSTASDYPYYGEESQCARNNPNNSYKLAGYKRLTKGDEDNLLRAIYNIGPISIALDSGHDEFLFYESGIIDIPSCSTIRRRHAVLAVGYNLTETPYLIVKNSYGTNWGMDGYFKISLFNKNMCGIASWAHFPIIKR